MTQSPPEARSVPPPPSAPKTSGLAVASLICGIAGLCTCGVGGIVGLILAIMARRQISRSNGQLGGKGLATAGLVVSIITLLVGLILLVFTAGAFIRRFQSITETVRTMPFTTNVKVLCGAAVTYSAVHDGKLPPPDSWPQALQEDGIITDDGIFADPDDPGAGRAIAMNRAVVHAHTYDVAHFTKTVLFFECAPGSPLAGGQELLPPQPRYPGGYVIGFLDGHVEQVPREQIDALVWDPKPQ